MIYHRWACEKRGDIDAIYSIMAIAISATLAAAEPFSMSDIIS